MPTTNSTLVLPADSVASEFLLSAQRLDPADAVGFSASCETHRIAESGLRAMLDAFGPLSTSVDVYVTA